MKTPFVSIVVPMYNSENTIESCLDSLLNLNYPKNKYEIIVVDDHSTDKSAKIVSDFKKINGNVILLKQPIGKKGPAAARNLGISRAKGEFIASTDADEMMFPDWLNELIPYFSNQEVAAVGALLVEEHPLDSGLAPKIQSIIIDPHFKPGTVAAGNVVYRKKVLQEAGCFNEFCRFNDLDVDLHYRMQEKGFELMPIQKYLGQHKQRHTLRAFYKRMFGFGAAGMIISFLNFKSAFSTNFKNQKGVFSYFALFSLLVAYSIALIGGVFLDINLTFWFLLSALGAIAFTSLIWAGIRIKKTNSKAMYFPAVSLYIFAKLIALLHGIFYGFFYYLRRKK